MKHILILLFVCSAAACGFAETDALPTGDEPVTIMQEARGDSCPGGWYDAAVVRIVCEEGYTLDYRQHRGTTCVQCAPIDSGGDDASCKGPWKAVDAEIACAAGYAFDYNADSTCKRCVKVRGECTADSDCRTYSNYCGGCGCDALATNEAGETCNDPVQCFVDPCDSRAAVCNSGVCELADVAL